MTTSRKLSPTRFTTPSKPPAAFPPPPGRRSGVLMPKRGRAAGLKSFRRLGHGGLATTRRQSRRRLRDRPRRYPRRQISWGAGITAGRSLSSSRDRARSHCSTTPIHNFSGRVDRGARCDRLLGEPAAPATIRYHVRLWAVLRIWPGVRGGDGRDFAVVAAVEAVCGWSIVPLEIWAGFAAERCRGVLGNEVVRAFMFGLAPASGRPHCGPEGMQCARSGLLRRVAVVRRAPPARSGDFRRPIRSLVLVIAGVIGVVLIFAARDGSAGCWTGRTPQMVDSAVGWPRAGSRRLRGLDGSRMAGSRQQTRGRAELGRRSVTAPGRRAYRSPTAPTGLPSIPEVASVDRATVPAPDRQHTKHSDDLWDTAARLRSRHPHGATPASLEPGSRLVGVVHARTAGGRCGIGNAAGQ